MPPAPHEYHGIAAIIAFLRASAAWRAGAGPRMRLRPTRANGQPAFLCHLAGDDGVRPGGLMVLTLAGDHLRGMTLFLTRARPERTDGRESNSLPASDND